MQSLNKQYEEEKLEICFEELEEREELACVGAACGANVTPCLGNACLAACIGVNVCLLGLHTL